MQEGLAGYPASNTASPLVVLDIGHHFRDEGASSPKVVEGKRLKDIRPHFSSFLVQGVAEEDARRFLGRVDMKPTGMGADPDSRCKARLVHLSQELVFRPFMQTAGAAV